jgi:hypothetical protein
LGTYFTIPIVVGKKPTHSQLEISKEDKEEEVCKKKVKLKEKSKVKNKLPYRYFQNILYIITCKRNFFTIPY